MEGYSVNRKIFLLIVLMLTFASVSFAASPSDWAVKEVEKAKKQEIVPSSIEGRYQENITRSEYVEIAMELLDEEIDILEEEPFSDISDHPKKDLLIKAYNAGIIDGYGDGTFKPGNEISREEIAALVVKFLKVAKDTDNIEAVNTYEYKDNSAIAEWAKAYIDYCYENNILKGVDELTIQPKGNATIEQSIIIMYRLGMNKGIIEPKELDSLNASFNKDFVYQIKSLIKLEGIEISEVDSKYITLEIDERHTIQIVQEDYGYDLYAQSSDLDSEKFKTALKTLITVITQEPKDHNIVDIVVTNLKDDPDQEINTEISNEDVLHGTSTLINDENYIYTFSISLTK